MVQTQWLDKSYEQSKFPVPFYEGQTTFDAVETKKHFQVLIENNTLDLFWVTQQIDFVYMFATLIFTVTVMAAVYKTLSFDKRWQDIAWIMIFIMPLNVVMDIMENLVSFVMLSDPLTFSDWLIIPYSTFAVAKFFMYIAGYLWIVLALIVKAKHSFEYYKIKRANIKSKQGSY